MVTTVCSLINDMQILYNLLAKLSFHENAGGKWFVNLGHFKIGWSQTQIIHIQFYMDFISNLTSLWWVRAYLKLN